MKHPTPIPKMTREQRDSLIFNLSACVQVITDATQKIKEIAENNQERRFWIVSPVTANLDEIARNYIGVIDNLLEPTEDASVSQTLSN